MRAARGVSLIEVLVAILVFSLGLIGLALMQLRGATFTKESVSRTMAILQTRALADRMQANPDGVANGDYLWNSSSSGIPASGDCAGKSDQAAIVACNDIGDWLRQMNASLPLSADLALGKVVDNGDGTYTLSAGWNGLNVINNSGSEDIAQSFVFIPVPRSSATSGG